MDQTKVLVLSKIAQVVSDVEKVSPETLIPILSLG